MFWGLPVVTFQISKRKTDKNEKNMVCCLLASDIQELGTQLVFKNLFPRWKFFKFSNIRTLIIREENMHKILRWSQGNKIIITINTFLCFFTFCYLFCCCLCILWLLSICVDVQPVIPSYWLKYRNFSTKSHSPKFITLSSAYIGAWLFPTLFRDQSFQHYSHHKIKKNIQKPNRHSKKKSKFPPRSTIVMKAIIREILIILNVNEKVMTWHQDQSMITRLQKCTINLLKHLLIVDVNIQGFYPHMAAEIMTQDKVINRYKPSTTLQLRKKKKYVNISVGHIHATYHSTLLHVSVANTSATLQVSVANTSATLQVSVADSKLKFSLAEAMLQFSLADEEARDLMLHFFFIYGVLASYGNTMLCRCYRYQSWLTQYEDFVRNK
ncbi:hypothetical protein VP01_1560g3 [Puccinia sorghi]|uniref:Uncharacterized protein n=1 Tax=Puccinia sorghi TaxID=27349 RepID=A0A0L6VJV1_9BASI|nr:hypothetical protein VP01_1560g3 [Puccinia sorghi]